MSYITLQELQNMKKEKERCKNTYPDWKDDKFNCLDNKFIFAVKSSEDHSDEEPSFHTLNDFTVYYNRKSKLYFMELDLPLKYTTDTEAFVDALDNIRNKFWIFLLHLQDNKIFEPSIDNYSIQAQNYPWSSVFAMDRH